MECSNFVLYQNIELVEGPHRLNMLQIMVDALRLNGNMSRTNLVRMIDTWLENNRTQKLQQRSFEWVWECALGNFGVDETETEFDQLYKIEFRQAEKNLYTKVRTFLMLMSPFIHKETFELAIFSDGIARYDFSWKGDILVISVRPLSEYTFVNEEDNLVGFNTFLPTYMNTILS